MKIIKEDGNKIYKLTTKEIKLDELKNIGGEQTNKIIEILKDEPLFPKQIAKKLQVHEQNIYYHIKKLEDAKIIEIKKQETINGSTANFYGLVSDSVYLQFKPFTETGKIAEKETEYLKPFIIQGKLNAIIVVGSPDPHGPQKARSKDGYFGMDLALFLGTYLTHIDESKVKLDTEITDKEIKENNLIVIGGPIVNRVSEQINTKMPIYFDEEKKGIYSSITKKTYFADETGIINKIPNPENPENSILFIAGIRNSGTKASILAFLKHFETLQTPNFSNKKSHCHVVEGIDLDSDGKVDNVEFLE